MAKKNEYIDKAVEKIIESVADCEAVLGLLVSVSKIAGDMWPSNSKTLEMVQGHIDAVYDAVATMHLEQIQNAFLFSGISTKIQAAAKKKLLEYATENYDVAHYLERFGRYGGYNTEEEKAFRAELKAALNG